jgi:Arc/MetJ-type ribon-helix-helix transcriptional regulator
LASAELTLLENKEVTTLVHNFAQTDIDDARELVEAGDYNQAANFVRNSLRQIEDYTYVDYGPWKERFDELYAEFQEETEKTEATITYDEQTEARKRPPRPDDEKLHTILDDLLRVMDGMAPLRDEYQQKHYPWGDEDDDESGRQSDNTSDDGAPYCLRCRREPTEIVDSKVYAFKNAPDNTFLCGKCFFEIKIEATEEVPF